MTLVSTVKEKASLVAAHAPDVVKTGAETLKAAREVVDHSRRDAKLLLERTRDELKQTLKQGADQVRHKLAHLAEPTHKEQAEAKKAAVKAKKRARRAQASKITPIHGEPAAEAPPA